jgi:EcsC protein family
LYKPLGVSFPAQEPVMSTRIKVAPAKSSRPARARLTAYESAQVSQIAGWKSKPPNPFFKMIRKITMPGAKVIDRILPDEMVRVAIDKAYQLAVKLAGKEDIKKRAGVGDLTDLRKKPLEDCDRMAFQVGVFSQVLATAEGAATGAGGMLTTLLDIPLMFVLSLRTILKIGHCFGYPLDQHKDERFVLGVLIAATSGTLAARRLRLDQLHALEDMIIEESQEEILADEVFAILFQLQVFESVPGLGTISGAALNLAFMRSVDNVARRVFQERWLRENGRVRSIIAPAPAASRDLAEGWGGIIAQAAHTGCYCAGFGVALPAYLLASLFQPMDNSLIQGIKAGAGDARRGVDLTLSSLNGETASRSRSPSRRPVAALGRS